MTTGGDNIEIFDAGNSADGTTDGSLDPTTGPTIRIGTEGTQTQAFMAGVYGATTSAYAVPVYIDSNGNLGTLNSVLAAPESTGHAACSRAEFRGHGRQ